MTILRPNVAPCISLWQPWASLVVLGLKPFETRHHRAPERVVGQRVLIHAAKRRVRDAERTHFNGVLDAMGEHAWDYDALPFGAIVGSAVLSECCLLGSPALAGAVREFASNRQLLPGDDGLGNYAPGRFAWRMEQPVAFRRPVEERGRQSWWSVPLERVPEIEAPAW